MSILVKGMGMPERCADCPMCYDFIRCRLLEKSFKEFDCVEYRWEYCPLVELPKHGRLIDADKLPVSTFCSMSGLAFKHVWLDNIENAPTVIEAEGAET